MAKLEDFIVRKTLGNTDENQKNGNSAFNTHDYVFIESYNEVINRHKEENYIYASDYSVMNGACLSREIRGPKNRRSTWQWLRSANSKNCVKRVFDDGSLGINDVGYTSAGLCPVLHLNLSSVISARSASRDNFRIGVFRDLIGEIVYHTIEFGFYPQDKAKNAKALEELFKKRRLTPTGRTYSKYMEENGSFQQNEEFEYDGKRYVRVISERYDGDSRYKDGTRASEIGTPEWAEVQPIKWKIKNWSELPKSINPNGKGTAKTIYVKSEEGITSGIPFHPSYGKTEHTMWQNSPLRAFLNSYDLHEELSRGNGNAKYMADINYNLKGKGKGFLQEAFSAYFDKIKLDESSKTL